MDLVCEVRDLRQGCNDPHWSTWIDVAELTNQASGVTLIVGEVADKAVLYGGLGKDRNPGLSLLSVRRADPSTTRRAWGRPPLSRAHPTGSCGSVPSAPRDKQTHAPVHQQREDQISCTAVQTSPDLARGGG